VPTRGLLASACAYPSGVAELPLSICIHCAGAPTVVDVASCDGKSVVLS
jgi:hypothetical protein